MSRTLVIRNNRLRVAISLFVFLACSAMALSFAKHISQPFAGSVEVPLRNQAAARQPEGNAGSGKPKFVGPESPPSTQFDLSRNIIAGGGGTSANGNFRLEGTVGQSVAGTTSVGGQFSGTGGLWQAGSGVLGTPTPTPTPSPTPTPTATPTPTPNLNAPVIFVEEGTVNRAVALDSVTFTRGPFKVLDDYNFSADHHTRVIIFTSNLGLTQPDPSVLTVEASGFNLPVENVGLLTGVSGLNASYIVVRLPDGLPSGDLLLTVKLNGNPSNITTLAISP